MKRGFAYNTNHCTSTYYLSTRFRNITINNLVSICTIRCRSDSILLWFSDFASETAFTCAKTKYYANMISKREWYSRTWLTTRPRWPSWSDTPRTYRQRYVSKRFSYFRQQTPTLFSEIFPTFHVKRTHPFDMICSPIFLPRNSFNG